MRRVITARTAISKGATRTHTITEESRYKDKRGLGDGKCWPTPSCPYLERMPPGQTASIRVRCAREEATVKDGLAEATLQSLTTRAHD